MILPRPRSVLFSYAAILAVIVLAAALHLMTPFVTVLFAYFILTKLNSWHRRRWLAVAIFLVLVAALFWGFAIFVRNAWIALPEIISTAFPIVAQFAERHGVELPFTDFQGLKEMALTSVHETLGYVGNFARVATKEFVLLVIAVVIAINLFINAHGRNWQMPPAEGTDLYTYYTNLVSSRFRDFYKSFELVMSAQLVISAINTFLTALFVFGCSLRYASVAIAVTFICGLIPVIGNILSNTLIVGIAFTKSPQMAAWALLFLITIHKLEYFLNSRIIGEKIHHPMWLMLLALIFGEQFMGIPGMILAPVILSFVHLEASKYKVIGGALHLVETPADVKSAAPAHVGDLETAPIPPPPASGRAPV